jgi:hypothetical protein
MVEYGRSGKVIFKVSGMKDQKKGSKGGEYALSILPG